MLGIVCSGRLVLDVLGGGAWYPLDAGARAAGYVYGVLGMNGDMAGYCTTGDGSARLGARGLVSRSEHEYAGDGIGADETEAPDDDLAGLVPSGVLPRKPRPKSTDVCGDMDWRALRSPDSLRGRIAGVWYTVLYTLFDQPPDGGPRLPSSVFVGTLPRRARSEGGIGAGIGECWNDSGARLHDAGCTYTVRESVEVAELGVDGVAISYDDTEFEERELGPRGGRETSTAGLMPGFAVVASMFRFESDDEEAHRLFSWWAGGTTGGGGDADEPDDERGRSRRISTLSGSRDDRREICPDAIEPRRPRRGGRAKNESEGRAGRAVVGVVLDRDVSVVGRWCWWPDSAGVSGNG